MVGFLLFYIRYDLACFDNCVHIFIEEFGDNGMRKLINYDTIKNEKDFWLIFLMGSFPESLDNETDETLSEIISGLYGYNRQWADDFTGYYDGIFDECDGYIDDPTTLEIELSTGEKLYIEFHPGDTIYFINDEEIGCTGPEYFIHKLDWQKYVSYTHSLSCEQKLLLMPMLAVKDGEKNELNQIIVDGLKATGAIKEADYERICGAIIENCLFD